MDGWELVRSERVATVDFLAGLEPAEWAVQSLCPDWTVHDVVAHLVSVLDAGPLEMLRAAVVGTGRPPRITAALARRWSDRTPEQLLASYREHLDSRFRPPGMGSAAPLTDLMVHRLDIAVPLDRTVERPPEAWRPVLDFMTGRWPMMGSIRGGRPEVRWRTTDLDWSSGSGPEVSGSADAVGLAIGGRSALLDRLEGDGVPLVAAWLSR